ncbi:PucR family transcriptional regulator [Mycolicibacterium sp.]|uniref:PucR family transcriptional regulator n=1 Tax=Mycolicibacterium sp. TaxID=2320850 RepID=UPI003D0DE4D0
MLSLAALLADPALELEVQVPGPAGALDHEVLWLHNTELPDPSPYVRATEVVLTNGLWRESTPAGAFVAALQRGRAGGLIFGLTEQTPTVPADLVAACQDAGLPLVSVSIAVPFTAITEAAARIQGAARQDALAKLVRRGDALAMSIARGAGAEGVLAVLRRDLDLPLLVVDRMGRRLAGVDIDADADADADVDLDTSAAAALARRPPPLEVDLPTVGPAALFLVEGAMGEVDAAVFCLRPLRDISAAERDAIEQAARFLSLEVTKQQALQAIESRFASELLEMILSGSGRASEVQDRLRAFGIDPSAQLAVITIVVGDGPVRPAGSTDEVERFFRSRGLPAVVVAGSQDTVVIFPWKTDDTELVALCRRLSDTVRQRFPDDRVVVGVGALAPDSAALREPLIGSREVCQVLRRRHTDSRVGSFADVSTYRMLLGLHDRAMLRRFADDVLAPLRRHDQHSGTELERTLRVFLAHDGHWSTAAQDLYIHVNTLRNRVSRIGELTGRDVTRLDDRVDLFLALEADALARG